MKKENTITGGYLSDFDKAGWLSRYTFYFLWPLARKTRDKRERLSSEDFDKHAPNCCQVETACEPLISQWDKIVKIDNSSKSKKQISLMRVIARVYGLEFASICLITLFIDCVSDPLYFYFCTKLIHIIGHFPQDPRIAQASLATKTDNNSIYGNDLNYQQRIDEYDSQIWSLCLNSLAFLIAVICTSMLIHPYVWLMSKLALKIRTALAQMIYRKSLKIDKSREINYKQAISLISKDIDAINGDIHQICWVISGPLECIILTSIMGNSVGYLTALVSLAMCALMVSQSWINKHIVRKHTIKGARLADQRFRLFTEAVNSIRILRMYSWTRPMFDKIVEARDKEIRKKRITMFMRGIDELVFFVGFPGSALLTILFGHYIMGVQINQLFVSQVFLITMTHRRTLARYLPQGMLAWINISIVFERIEKYLRSTELSTELDTRLGFSYQHQVKTCSKDHTEAPSMIELQNISAKWYHNEHTSLSNINLKLLNSELLFIAGKVGSGKSTLIQLILAELAPSSGLLKVNGKLSYAAQEAWVWSGTIRENILFGEQMDKRRYMEVLRVCSLLYDLETFPASDLTQVGERGVTLSGGQKARINLARCLYQKADIYILDDPLSAVDPHVGQHIFHEAIKGFLQDKSVILVTHQLQFARFADKILILEETRKKKEALKTSDCDAISKVRENQKEFVRRPSEVVAKELMMLHKVKEFIDSTTDNNRLSLGEDEEKDEVEKIVEAAREPKAWEAISFYLRNVARPIEYLFYALISALARVLFIFMNIWLNLWAGEHEENVESFGTSIIQHINLFWASMISFVIIFCLLIVSIIRALQFNIAVLRATQRIHSIMVKSILWARLNFFDTTPPGQLINRVAADLSYMDTKLITILADLSIVGISAVSMFSTIVLAQLKLFINAMIVIGVAVFVFIRFIKLVQSIKQVDGLRKSQLFTQLSVSLDGLSTIRASRKQQLFLKMFSEAQNRHTSIFFLNICVKRLLINTLDWLMLTFYISLILFDIFDTIAYNKVYAFIGLNFVMQTSRITQNSFTQFMELYTQMQSLTRIKEFCELKQEAEQLDYYSSDISKDDRIQEPNEEALFDEARVEFKSVSLKFYRKGDIVLKGINFELKPGEKVGIVGRTGAGKSSIISILFRLYHFEGFVYIDDQDTKSLQLDSLRRSISIIPQDPVLFSGTLRHNLDPMDEYPDSELWVALEAVQMKQTIASMSKQLEFRVDEAGTNFSVGQRQLICLARAILRHNKLLVLDEATANVDPDTDSLIQTAIRKEFKDCTVITVAHRLQTIIDSDRIMVLDKGEILEFDSPDELLKKEDGLFYKMMRV